MAAVTILGAGSWGTALGARLARLGHEVALWARNPEFAAQLEAAGENTAAAQVVVDLMTRGLKRESD